MKIFATENRSCGSCFFYSAFIALGLISGLFLWSALPGSYALFFTLASCIFLFVSKRVRAPLDKVDWAVLGAICLLFLNVQISGNTERAAMQAACFASGLLVFLVLSGTAAVERFWGAVTYIVIGLGGLCSAWAVVQYFENFGRVAGPVIDANAFAAVCYSASFLLLVNNKRALWNDVLQLLLLCSLFATFSRGGNAAWLLGVMGIAICCWRVRPGLLKNIGRYLVLAVIAYLVVKVLPLLFGIDPVARNYDDLSHLGYRWPMWEATWELVKRAPLLGSGLGSFALLYPQVRTEFISAGLNPHNDYVQLLQEGGLVLLVPFMAWMGVHLYWLFRILVNKANGNTNYRLELALLLVTNLAFFAHATINFIFYNFYHTLLAWIIFARICWLAKQVGFLSTGNPVLYRRYLGFAMGLMLCLIWEKLFFIHSADALYSRWNGKPAWVQRLSQSDKLLAFYLRFDATNAQASEVYIRSLITMLPLLPDKQRQQAFAAAWQQVSLLTSKRPWLVGFHTLSGDLLKAGHAASVEGVPVNAALLHWQHAVERNPGFLPAYLKIAREIEDQHDQAKALQYLLGSHLPWVNVTPWPKAKPYWLEVLRLAQATDSPLQEKIERHIQQGDQMIDDLSPLRFYYKG